MQLLAMPLLGELAAITGTSPATAAAGSGGVNGADGKGAAPFGQLLAQLQGEGGKQLPPAELAAALGISVEQLQQALAQLRQALADYNRQQTGASGILPALVDGANDGEVAAINEDGEAFLLWLADQQQGLAGEVDPSLVAALQQWLNEQQAEPANADLTVGSEQPLVDSDAETVALLAEEAESAAQQAGAEATETAKATQAESRAASAERQTTVATATATAAATASSQQTAALASAAGEPSATVEAASPTSVSGSESGALAAASSPSASLAAGQAVAAEAETATISDKRQPAPAVPQAATTVASAATATTATATVIDGNEQASRAGTDASVTDGSVSDGSERRTTATTLAAALASQQRGGDNSNRDGTGGGRDSGRDSSSNSSASAQTDGESDQPQLQVGERLSQWQFQWERASNDAASGITTAATSRDSQDLRQLLGASSANLQASRLVDSVGQENTTLLRQFSADPAAALGPQVQVMVARSLDQMTVRLDPQELGSMSIKVQVGADQQVHVQFQVSNPATRDLVEQSLPKLRELLGDAGVQLGDTQVGQQQRETRQMAGDSSGRSGDGRGGAGGQGGDGDTELEQVADQLQRNSGQLANGRLDFYV